MHPSQNPKLRKIAPGIYDDGHGGVHVSAREVLASLGAAYTWMFGSKRNEDLFCEVLREISLAHGANFEEVEARDAG